ncbi:uncharacterized protein PITG_11371 [Phytophthora infestans T30-4]|uniref:Transmembrane protein n=1 Tax=Phytophthora infestans (strain T30-4) TaxID=403677 RepID=D0NIM5_PHYIT|nr:uncharacterized protein PITG_11371 [Phytophthora infestans T30-4]EEY59359.1 conserved hypothetical protein [Phytophthora infestans T30-4]|eukprot:XP_002900969.1 conserved hypothetical protein [Phytophthora infestans T30-4]
MIGTTLLKLVIQELIKLYILKSRISSNVQLHPSNENLIQSFVLQKYIAIGCSAAVLYFLGENTHYYRLGLLRKDESVGISWRNGQFVALALQLAIEVFVDYLSVVFEMALGVQFAQMEELSSFFGAVFATIAFLNIVMTAMVYLD